MLFLARTLHMVYLRKRLSVNSLFFSSPKVQRIDVFYSCSLEKQTGIRKKGMKGRKGKNKFDQKKKERKN